LKKSRRKRRKNKLGPQSVVPEEGVLRLPFESEAPCLDGGGADGKAVESAAWGGEAADWEAVGGEAAVTETAELGSGGGEASSQAAAELEAAVSEAADGKAAESAALEGMAAEQEAANRGARERRQHARFVVGGRAKGRVTAIYDARILDISPGGSLIEHAHVVRPGTMSSLDLNLLGKRMSLRCRVARSVVHRSEVQQDGDKELIFHTGLEFLDRSDETRKMIIDYIRSIIEDGNSI
jgi:hypothetical protein